MRLGLMASRRSVTRSDVINTARAHAGAKATKAGLTNTLEYHNHTTKAGFTHTCHTGSLTTKYDDNCREELGFRFNLESSSN